jgi:hypothetical protein
MPEKLGTLLPTPQSLDRNARWAHNNTRALDAIGNAELKDCERRTVGGEVRYYRNATQFAVVGMNDHRVKWFEHRQDGVYAIR